MRSLAFHTNVALPRKRDQEGQDHPWRSSKIELAAFSVPVRALQSGTNLTYSARAWLPRSPFADLSLLRLIKKGNWLSQVGARFPTFARSTGPSESRTQLSQGLHQWVVGFFSSEPATHCPRAILKFVGRRLLLKSVDESRFSDGRPLRDKTVVAATHGAGETAPSSGKRGLPTDDSV